MKLHRLFASLAAGCLVAHIAAAQVTTVKIIAFNDFHGTLQSPGTFGGFPSGGAEALAGYVAKLKAQNPNNVVVSAGDLLGASPLISGFFHDEGTIEAMNRLGLEFSAVGNHDFDEGPGELRRMQNGGCHPTDPNSCEGPFVGTPTPFEGAKFKFLSANVIEDATNKTLFVPYGIKAMGGVRVGFIGMTLKDTPSIVSASGVAGLTFLDEAATVNSLVAKLRARGVEAIVVLVHQGGFQGTAAPNFINDCSGDLQDPITSPIKAVVSQLDDAVDLVISAHTHIGYNCRLPNKIGRKIPVTQASAFGRIVSDIDLSIDTATGDVMSVTANNLIVNRNDVTITFDAEIAGIVNAYNTLVSPLANQVIGTITQNLPSSADATGEMPAGNLIADAQLEATSPPQLGGAVIALMNAGGVRNPGLLAAALPHDVTYGEAFTVQPFGNILVTVTLTAQQIKDVLEQQFTGCNGQVAQRILQISNGFSFSWSAGAPPCQKIVDVALNGIPLVSSGTVLQPNQPFRVAINNFIAGGGDNFTVLKGATNALTGAIDIDALVAYLTNGFKSPNHPPYDPTSPALHKPRVTKLP